MTSALSVALKSVSGLVSVPASVTIPAGAQQVSFSFAGAQAGVDDLIATPSDASSTRDIRGFRWPLLRMWC